MLDVKSHFITYFGKSVNHYWFIDFNAWYYLTLKGDVI